MYKLLLLQLKNNALIASLNYLITCCLLSNSFLSHSYHCCRVFAFIRIIIMGMVWDDSRKYSIKLNCTFISLIKLKKSISMEKKTIISNKNEKILLKGFSHRNFFFFLFL